MTQYFIQGSSTQGQSVCEVLVDGRVVVVGRAADGESFGMQPSGVKLVVEEAHMAVSRSGALVILTAHVVHVKVKSGCLVMVGEAHLTGGDCWHQIEEGSWVMLGGVLPLRVVKSASQPVPIIPCKATGPRPARFSATDADGSGMKIYVEFFPNGVVAIWRPESKEQHGDAAVSLWFMDKEQPPHLTQHNIFKLHRKKHSAALELLSAIEWQDARRACQEPAGRRASCSRCSWRTGCPRS
jgi:hypothetical protein